MEQSDIKTFCKNCVFQLRDNSVQIGCHLNNEEKLCNNGGELIKDGPDFIINNRICVHFRNQGWINKQSLQNYSKDLDYLVSITQKELKLKYTAILYIDYNTPLETIQQTIESLKKQKTQPKEIILINPPKNIAPAALRQICSTSGFKWRIENLIWNEKQEKTPQDNIRIAINKIKTIHILVLNQTQPITYNNLVETIEDILYHKYQKMILAKDKDNNITFIQTQIAKNLHYDIEAIIQIAKEEECLELIWEIANQTLIQNCQS